MFEDLVGIGQLADIFLHFLVPFQELDGEVTGGEALTKIGLFLQVFLNFLDAMLQFVSVIDMDMPVVCVGIFGAFIDLYDLIVKIVHALARLEDGGHHRQTEELRELVGIHVVTALHRFVEHVERYDHTEVHVDELCGEVEVAFEVACVDDIDHHIRCLLHELLAHVELFGGVGGERIGAREINEVEGVAFILGMSFLGIHGHARIVAYALVRTGGKVEERGLATVGVAHQCHVDDLALLLGSLLHLLVRDARQRLFIGLFRIDGNACWLSVVGKFLFFLCFLYGILFIQFPRFFLGYDFNHVSFRMAKADLVTHDAVFYRIF